MNIILRRAKLGRTSCRELNQFIKGKVVRNDKYNGGEVDTLIRWGCTSRVAAKKTINTVEAIHQVNDKVAFRKMMPEGVCPKTCFSVADFNLKFPVIVRPSRHAQGRNLHLCNNIREVIEACNIYAGIGYYISEYVPKVKEYRVFVVGGRVACVAQKTPGNPDAIAWNVAQGGRFDNVKWQEWPIEVVKKAVEAFSHTSLDFGGVDVMLDKDGKAYVLEINSAPSLTSPYRQKCMGLSLKWLVDKGKKRIPTKVLDKNKYRGYIHPAVSENAEV